MIDVEKIQSKIDCYLSPLQVELLELLEDNGPMTRDVLVKITKRARTTVFDNLKVLISNKLVKRFTRPTDTRGRPVVFFKLIDEE